MSHQPGGVSSQSASSKLTSSQSVLSQPVSSQSMSSLSALSHPENKKIIFYKAKKGGVKNQNIEKILTNPEIDPPPRSCFTCWRFGHFVLDCKQPKSLLYCSNCGRKGRIVRTCERCRKAYLNHQNALSNFENNNKKKPEKKTGNYLIDIRYL